MLFRSRPAMLIATASVIGAVVWMRRGAPPFSEAVVAGLSRWRRWGERTDMSRRRFYLMLVIVSVLLAIGPPAGLWPLVYQLPGFSLIRVPSRFILLALLGGAVLAGHGVERIVAWAPARLRAGLASALGALVLIEAAVVPLPTEAYRIETPSVDRWLTTAPHPVVVAEVPLANPRDLGAWERRHTAYLLHSMAHWQKTVHGYSG